MSTPLHNHSYYSAYDGLSKPRQIAERVLDLGFSACGCTDHDVVAGHLEFYKTMKEFDIKPVLGIETYQTPGSRYENAGSLKHKETKEKIENFHLLILAMNNTGLQNLWALNTEAHRSGHYYHGRVDWELLEKYNEGLIVTSACFLGMMQQALAGNKKLEEPEVILSRYLDIFGDRFYLELSTYPVEDQRKVNIDTVAIAKQFGVPVVYANDAHYATPDQYNLHEEIMALSQNKKMIDPIQEGDEKKGRPHHEPHLYIMGEEDIKEHLDYLPLSIVSEAIASSDHIGHLCNVTLPEFKQHVPLFVPDMKWKTGREMLLGLVEEGFEKKIVQRGKDKQVYFERLKNELEVIYAAGLVDYLLIVRDYCVFADSMGIMKGPGRGSAGGSLAVYLLDITDVDPLEYGLIFERFYNAGRETSLPDIDIDFATEGRETIKEYIFKKYGAEHVADIGTVSRLHAKGAFGDVARVQSVPYLESKAVSGILHKSIKQGLQSDWDSIEEELGPALAPYKEKYPDWFKDAIALLETKKDSKDEQVKTYGVHATGVLVSDVPLAGNFPLRMATNDKKEKKLVSQWDMRDAEKLGFQKIDICGLRNLDTLTYLNRMLVEKGKEPIDFKEVQYMNHAEEMWQQLDKGQTVGIFQVEEAPLVKQIAKQIKPRSIMDLSALLAMNRPGPLQSKDANGRSALERFIAGSQGHEVDYLNDVVAAVTQETFGIFLYQEQIINFMTSIGYSLMEADNVRSMMGKKKKEMIDKEYHRYLPLACNYMPEAEANELWNQIKNFAMYGFNKSHSVEYAIITLWCLYAKWLYPIEYLAASVITVDKDKKARYVNEAKRIKVPVYAPEFGKAKALCSTYEDGIMLGYIDVQGIGVNAANWLEKNTWASMTGEELIDTVGKIKFTQPSNGKQVKAIKADVIESLERLGLTGRELTKDERLLVEEELLKVAISDDSAKILEEYSSEIAEYCMPYSSIEEAGEYSVAGVIRGISSHKTKFNKPYAKIKIADEIDEMEIFVWNDKLSKLGFIFRNRTAGIFSIKRDNDQRVSLLDAVVLYPKDHGKTLYDGV